MNHFIKCLLGLSIVVCIVGLSFADCPSSLGAEGVKINPYTATYQGITYTLTSNKPLTKPYAKYTLFFHLASISCWFRSNPLDPSTMALMSRQK